MFARGSARTGKKQEPAPRAVVYRPHGSLGLGLVAWREMTAELWDSRELAWRLFLRDFSARFRQSVLGYVWAVVPAVLTVATFTFLNRSDVLPIAGTDLPYPVFVLLGMTVWQLFASGLTGATQSLVNAGQLITKINFPRETLVLAAFGQSVFEFGVRALLVAAAFAWYGVTPAWTVALVPLAILPLCFLTLGLGFIFSMVNGVLRDAGQAIISLLTFWMFLTPVVYPLPEDGFRRLLIGTLNPVSPFVVATHDLTTHGALLQPAAYALACAVALAVFLLGWRLFHLAEPRIAERV